MNENINIRFLGTGAADWVKGGPWRRNSSILVDGHTAIDLTASVEDTLMGTKVDTIFYTHSHSDHFQPEVALKAGVKTVYASDSWIERTRSSFQKSSEKLGFPMPMVIGLGIGDKVTVKAVTYTALPANHATKDLKEQTIMYLLEKGNSNRVLYATDTSGIPAIAGRIAGIDPHDPEGRPISGLIMEATMPDDEDFRIFAHSSYLMVSRTVSMLVKNGRYLPPKGQAVYLTHLASSIYHMSDDQLDSILPAPLTTAKDGQEVSFRPGLF